MKKLIFTLAGISLSGLLFAQFSTDGIPKAKFYPEAQARAARHTVFAKSSITAWYNPLEFIKPTMGNTLGANGSINFSSNDSLFKTIFADQSGNPTGTQLFNSQLGFGMVLDPKDESVSNAAMAIQLTKNNPYTLDSVGFKYIYVRNVDVNQSGDPIIDTLFIAFFKGSSQITTGSLDGKYGTVGWNAAKHMPSNYTDIDTVLLDGFTLPPTTTSNNEQSFGFGYVTFPAPANFDVAANSLVGYTITFKSGIPPVNSTGTDTAIMVYQLDPTLFPLPSNSYRVNYFGSLQSFDDKFSGGTTWSNPTYYNTSLFQLASTGYGQNIGTLRNKYIPGVGFNSNRFADAYPLNAQDETPYAGFLVTCNNVGLDDIKNDAFVMSNVYPNPARSSDMATLAFTLKQAGTVNISIINLVGQEVKSVLSKKYNAGSITESFDLAGLKPGIYLLNMNVNGSSMSQKLTIVE